MAISPLAGKPAPDSILIDVDALRAQYFDVAPNTADPQQLVAFGTSGQRGTSSNGSFNEAHILAITQAIVEHRHAANINGPLYIGMDSHALSLPAQRTAIDSSCRTQCRRVSCAGRCSVTATPSVSRAILSWNRSGNAGRADGIVITPSHNPPSDGGFKYNPPNGGPADTDITGVVQDRANALLKAGNREVKRLAYASALARPNVHSFDFITPYVEAIGGVIDIDAIRGSGIAIAADPLGGASLPYWQPIAEKYELNLTIVNQSIDMTFCFMTVDHDGKIRMDCSSPYAMANLVRLKDDYDIAFGNDTDADRHGIVTPSAGLMNPNAFLAVSIWYLFNNRAGWSKDAAIGKTLVSSSFIDRVGALIGRKVIEVPVGFKWFVSGLLNGSLGFGGEESAGASFLMKDGTVWTTDKDGLVMGLLAAEITAKTGKDPSEHYFELAEKLGMPAYTRVDENATPAQKKILANLKSEQVRALTMAGEPITDRLVSAPGNEQPLGGLESNHRKSRGLRARPIGYGRQVQNLCREF